MKKATKLLGSLLLTCTLSQAQTLVTVNGVSISQNDVDTALMNATQGRLDQIPSDKQAEFRKQVLQQLIATELVYGDAKKIGITKSKEFKDEYQKVQENIKKQLALQLWQKKQLDAVKVSNKELKSYYDTNKAEFNEKESVHARHILVANDGDAKSIINELKSLKGDKLQSKFIELAKSKSTGPSGPKGGDLGFFSQGQMVPEFNDTVFSMKVGTITTEPVKTQFGYHVIYLEEKKAGKTRGFTEVKSFIEQRLKMEKFKGVMEEKMKALEKSATIK